MKQFAAICLLCGAMLSLYLGAATGAPSVALDRNEMAQIDGGQTWYCSTAFTNTDGCKECILVQSGFRYSQGGMPMTVNIYKRCDNNSVTKACLQNPKTGDHTPVCTKTTNQSCGTAATAYTDNVCVALVSHYIQDYEFYPADQITCAKTYDDASTVNTTGVNCSNVTPNVVH